jgi:hypothetical protein
MKFQINYLLREGIWTLEDNLEKVLFKNLGKIGFIEEVRVHLQSFQYEAPDNPKNKTKKIRKANQY